MNCITARHRDGQRFTCCCWYYYCCCWCVCNVCTYIRVVCVCKCNELCVARREIRSCHERREAPDTISRWLARFRGQSIEHQLYAPCNYRRCENLMISMIASLMIILNYLQQRLMISKYESYFPSFLSLSFFLFVRINVQKFVTCKSR